MSIVLWPRQEILQLVVPQLGSIGKTLDNTTAINAVRQLIKYQTIEGKIRYVTLNLLRILSCCLASFCSEIGCWQGCAPLE